MKFKKRKYSDGKRTFSTIFETGIVISDVDFDNELNASYIEVWTGFSAKQQQSINTQCWYFQDESIATEAKQALLKGCIIAIEGYHQQLVAFGDDIKDVINPAYEINVIEAIDILATNSFYNIFDKSLNKINKDFYSTQGIKRELFVEAFETKDLRDQARKMREITQNYKKIKAKEREKKDD